VVTIGSRQYPYALGWNGEPLAGRSIALDSETELAEEGGPAPRLALATAAGEHEAVVIHADQLAPFIRCHRDQHILTWNGGGFDFWVIERFLREIGAEEALAAWWAIVDADLFHDGMLLDCLLRLAATDGEPFPRNLAECGKEYAGLEISKADPHRLRYSEIIGKDWQTVDVGFFDYAIRDAIVTWHTYRAMYLRGKELNSRFNHGRDVYSNAIERFGLFTEQIQVRKAIALAQITRNGMHIDPEFVSSVVAALEERMHEAAAEAKEVLQGVYSNGPSKAKSGKPSINTRIRDDYLSSLAPPTFTATGKVSARRELWEEFADRDDFVRAWLTVEAVAKDLMFFSNFSGESIHPRYATLKRSGRTSAFSPNIQALPRGGDVRRAFVASTGHLLFAVDYSAIELRTFAAHAYHRYGFSDLRDTFLAGIDPHERTGAMMLGMPLEDFRALKKFPEGSPERKTYAGARQAAKPINFGVPGGLGAKRLAALAKRDYHVDMTEEQAETQKTTLCQSIVRELQPWLEESGTLILARSLQTTPEEIRRFLGDTHLSCIRKTLAGNPVGNDGKPYSPELQSRIWVAVHAANRNPEIAAALATRTASEDLARTVCHAGVATLTGRIRGRASYGQCRNTPFQGLAADGAGLALYRLIKEGFRMIAFVHDEVLIELPDLGGCVSMEAVERVEQIMEEEMASVLCGGIPVAVESGLMRRWHKGAGMRMEGDRAYPTDPPEPPQFVPAVSQDHDPRSELPATSRKPSKSKKACQDCSQASKVPALGPEPSQTTLASPEIIYSTHIGTSDKLFPQILQLHVPLGSTIADVTFGRGVFWKKVDPSAYRLLATDLKTDTDCRHLPYRDGELDAVVLDPPFFTRRGKSRRHGDFDARYSSIANSNEHRWHDAILALYLEAGQEAARVLRPDGILIVKCQDEVCSHRQRFTHLEVINAYQAWAFTARTYSCWYVGIDRQHG
jgi:hypothetical protein